MARTLHSEENMTCGVPHMNPSILVYQTRHALTSRACGRRRSFSRTRLLGGFHLSIAYNTRGMTCVLGVVQTRRKAAVPPPLYDFLLDQQVSTQTTIKHLLHHDSVSPWTPSPRHTGEIYVSDTRLSSRSSSPSTTNFPPRKKTVQGCFDRSPANRFLPCPSRSVSLFLAMISRQEISQ